MVAVMHGYYSKFSCDGKNHVSNILSRLGLRDRTQAAIYARDAGLI